MSTGGCGISLDRDSVSNEFQSNNGNSVEMLCRFFPTYEPGVKHAESTWWMSTYAGYDK